MLRKNGDSTQIVQAGANFSLKTISKIKAVFKRIMWWQNSTTAANERVSSYKTNVIWLLLFRSLPNLLYSLQNIWKVHWNRVQSLTFIKCQNRHNWILPNNNQNSRKYQEQTSLGLLYQIAHLVLPHFNSMIQEKSRFLMRVKLVRLRYSTW